jgi:FAD/FMN-containing dehydrogenase
MKLAHREHWTVVPAGAGTWTHIGNPLEDVNLLISTERLNQILEHEPADLITTAQAGVTLADLNRTLAQRGQWLPLDPPDDGHATLGGIVTTALSGAQRPGYGTARNFVIGMRVVLADGNVVKAGGRVVKNVAGYDMCKLFTGSYGTLGIISELTFKLRPLPASEVTVLSVGSLKAVIDAGRSILAARLFPVAVELTSGAMAKLLNMEITPGGVLMLIRFAGIEKTVAYQVKEAITILRGQSEVTDIETVSDDQGLWQMLAAVPLKTSHNVGWRAAVQPTHLREFVEGVKREYSDAFSTLPWQAGVADGRMRALDTAPGDTQNAVGMVRRLRAMAETMNGSVVLEKAPEQVKSEIDSWGSFGSAATLIKRVTEQLDPQGLLSPGRF